MYTYVNYSESTLSLKSFGIRFIFNIQYFLYTKFLNCTSIVYILHNNQSTTDKRKFKKVSSKKIHHTLEI